MIMLASGVMSSMETINFRFGSLGLTLSRVGTCCAVAKMTVRWA